MKKSKAKLEEINQNLDNEIAKITDMKRNFEEWAQNERNVLNQKRSEKLRTGKISMNELNDIIDILEDYENSTDSQKQFVVNTLTQLSQPI